MDKTSKLILWHRLAIVWLVVTTVTTALILRDEQQGKARLWIYLQRFARNMDQMDERHEEDKRLKQYESKYGEIQTVRQDKVVYLKTTKH